jgi:hypothetical protein
MVDGGWVGGYLTWQRCSNTCESQNCDGTRPSFSVIFMCVMYCSGQLVQLKVILLRAIIAWNQD